MRLLLVEDDATLLDVLRLAFSQRGWEVHTAANADDAFEAFSADTPDVVLTDKNLPAGPIISSQAGVELVRHIRQRDRGVGIVMMTAYGTFESARDTLNLGIDEYLEKPFDSLIGVVERVTALAARVAERRAAAATAEAPAGLTIIIAASAARLPILRGVIDAALRPNDRLVSVDRSEAIKPSAKNKNADLVILDGGSFRDEVTALVVQLKTRVRSAACVVLSQSLTLSDVKRLIDLEVRALVDEPIENERFAGQLRGVIERLRR